MWSEKYEVCQGWPPQKMTDEQGRQVKSGPHTLTAAEVEKFEVCKRLLREARRKEVSKGNVASNGTGTVTNGNGETQEGEEQELPFPLLDDNHAMNDEDLLLRFFIARNSKPEVALDTAFSACKWRREKNIESVFRWASETIDPQLVFKSHSDGLCGFYGIDSEGYPIWWERPNQKGIEELLSKIGMETALRWHVCMMERGRELAKALRVDRVTMVIDLKDVKGSSLMFGKAGQLLKAQSNQDQGVYPECMRKMFLINAPWGFSSAWSAIKVFLDKRLQEKITIMNKRTPGDALEKYVDPAHTPKEYGGTAEVDWDVCRLRPSTEPLIFKAPMYVQKIAEVQ